MRLVSRTAGTGSSVIQTATAKTWLGRFGLSFRPDIGGRDVGGHP